MTAADLSFMRPVSLRDDPGFRGYVIAPLAGQDGSPPRAVVAIAEPGSTGKRGNRAFALADLVPVAVVARNSR